MTAIGVTFPAWHGTSYVSAPEVLNALKSHVHEFVWQIRADEVAPGPGARQLQEISPGARLSTPELLDRLRPGAQIIDGELRGYDSTDSATPAVTLRAVDSTWWDVESEDKGLIAAVRGAFPDASPIDDDARES